MILRLKWCSAVEEAVGKANRLSAVRLLLSLKAVSDSETSETPVTIQQQLVSYQTAATPKELSSKESPVPYWLSKRQDWPHLARLALDVYSVPVMSDEPERVFSITGAAITPRRRLLKSDKIGYLMCLKAWIKAGVVSFDR